MNKLSRLFNFNDWMYRRNHLYLVCVFLSLIFCKYSSVDDGKSLYSIPEIKLWTPQSIETEFNQCTGIGLGQCGNFCSGIKSNKVAVIDCLNKNSKDISQCDDVYKALND